MFRLAHSLVKLTNSAFYLRAAPPVVRTSWRGARAYPLDPPVEIEVNEAEDTDVITIAGEKFKRRHRYWRWLCLPEEKKDMELIGKAGEYNIQWRIMTMFTDPPVYPGMKFYREWFDLMIRADMHFEVYHFYTLMVELQLDIIFEDDLTKKIEDYLEEATARSYHNWEY